MSTAAISTTSIFQELQSFYQTRRVDLKQLGSALQSGDLNGAQQAFQALSTLGQNGPFANSELFAKSTRDQAFDAIGQALQAGNLAAARTAFTSLATGRNISPPTPQSNPAAIVNLSAAQPNIEPLTRNSIYTQLQAFRQQRHDDLVQLGQALQSGDLAGAQKAFAALTALGQSGPNQNGQTFARTDRNQDFLAVGHALQSGDLAGAQSAFANLASSLRNQNPQAQNAISAYNSGVTEIIINFNTPPASTGGGTSTTGSNPRFVGPPIQEQPPTEPPVSQPPATNGVSGGGAEVVINFGGASGAGASGGSAAEVVINLGQGSGASTSASTPEIDIKLGGASGAGNSGGSTPEILVNLGQSGSSSSAHEEVTINLGNASGAEISIGAPQGQNGAANEQVTINLNQNQNYELILNLLSSSTSQSQSSSGNAVSLHA